MPTMFMSDPLPVTNCGERHIPAILLVDVSTSMEGVAIRELNQGLIEFGNALRSDMLAAGRADVCIISFGDKPEVEMSFRPASQYSAPVLHADGWTCMNKAIEDALDLLESRKSEYRALGVSYYRPWLFVLTDGEPTDTINEWRAKKKLRTAISEKKVVYMPMGIGPNADTKKLQEYYPKDEPSKVVLKATADNFKSAFVWLSNSIGIVSKADPTSTDQVQLVAPPPTITIEI